MPNTKTQLFTPDEIVDIYGVPLLDDSERKEYFTLNPDEHKVLNSFKSTKEAIYFCICLVFFKIKRTFVNFNYQDVTEVLRFELNCTNYPGIIGMRQAA
jgi:hypothetical protein